MKLRALLLLAGTVGLATIVFSPMGAAQNRPTEMSAARQFHTWDPARQRAATLAQVLPRYHDSHVHVRLPADPPVRRIELGRSSRGRTVTALEIAGRDPRRGQVLVVGCIHGNECAGTRVTRRLASLGRQARSDLWLVHDLNPDGRALGRRQNARGVDLNRNFPAGWRPRGKPWDPYYPGTRPLSEPETRAIARLILRIRPRTTIWFHQPQAVVRAWGKSIGAARRYAQLSGEPFRALRWPPGSASSWQNRLFAGASSFVVELPPGPLSRAATRRHAFAILALAG